MAKRPFSVSDYIKPEDVSKLDTEATAISFIPRERLLQNEKNFYDTSSIDELADSIALNGLIEPIIVRPVRDGSGDYRIISGIAGSLLFASWRRTSRSAGPGCRPLSGSPPQMS